MSWFRKPNEQWLFSNSIMPLGWRVKTQNRVFYLQHFDLGKGISDSKKETGEKKERKRRNQPNKKTPKE